MGSDDLELFLFPELFFPAHLGNRLRLGDYGGVEPLRKGAQTKTSLEREVSKSLERVKILTERPFSRSINSSRLSMVMLS